MKDFFEINELLIDNDIDVVFATQNIDTTSSMGRFNRNVLLAFAEFERDTIAERTREKLYSQAQKGYWGGGHEPLGYDVKDKRLIVNSTEAQLVQRVFNYYIEDPSTNAVSKKLNAEGFRTKARVKKDGTHVGAGLFTKQAVRDMLRNTIYIGQISFKEEKFKGLHDAVVEEGLFTKVQQRLDGRA
jgi:site-specific DNA recombinase